MTNPENLKIDETVQDGTTPEKKGGDGFRVEVVRSPRDAEILLKNLSNLGVSISHDKPLTVGQVLETEKALDSMKVVIGGEEMTIEEMKDIPDLESNLKIFEEIESDSKAGTFLFSSYQRLTYITPHIAELLLKVKNGLSLNWLPTLSDAAAEQLAKFYSLISLNGLTSISDLVAERLSKHKSHLYLTGLTFMSDIAAEHLSNHTGDMLNLMGLTSISDVAAEHFSKHHGRLHLDGLTSLSDKGAQYLANHKEQLYVSYEINQKIESFKTPKP